MEGNAKKCQFMTLVVLLANSCFFSYHRNFAKLADICMDIIKKNFSLFHEHFVRWNNQNYELIMSFHGLGEQKVIMNKDFAEDNTKGNSPPFLLIHSTMLKIPENGW